ncbi:MAG: 50S ribosomal protein L9 [Puniceicoccaceae bacterium]
MATTEILLLKRVENLGGEGDQVKVRAGYARNFLIPRKFALLASQSNQRQIQALRTARAAREANELENAKILASKIEQLSLVFAVQTGEGGKMFGAITANDLVEKAKEAGIELDKKKVSLYNPVKSLGSHSTRIRVHPEVGADLKFEVVSENPIEE